MVQIFKSWETFRFNDNIDFQLLSDVLDSVNFDELNEYSAVCLITAVFPYSEQITYYPFYNRFKEYMLTCISEEEFNKHYRNFEKGADDYWKRMKSYGAPEWISGKKPESNNG